MNLCSESLPKEFEKTTEVLPFTKYGLSTMQEFQEAETKIHHLEWLKEAGLTHEEIRLYQDNEGGLLDQQKKVEAAAMKTMLDTLYGKIKLAESKSTSPVVEDEKEKADSTKFSDKASNSSDKYPEGHPMNHINELEVDLFGHLHEGEIPPLSKRMKMLRRFERKKAHMKQVRIATCGLSIPLSKQDKESQKGNKKFSWSKTDNDAASSDWPDRPGHILNTDLPVRTWSEHSPTPRNRNDHHPGEDHFSERPGTRYHKYLLSPRANKEQIGPKNAQKYTIREGKIVRLQRNHDSREYEAEDIIVPENQAEEQLLEGTKMTVDNIRKIERFKEYEPGVPSKSLYLKNVAPAVTEEQVMLLFNQYVQANGGPMRVRLMKTGRMRGQAFVDFQDEEVAVQALTDINGTILSGRPIIAHFARNAQTAPG